MNKPLKSSALNYGLYLGLTLIAVTTIIYAFNLELFSNWWLGIILFLVIIGFGVVSAAKAKSLNNGFLSFKEGFSAYFITVAVGAILSGIVSIILFNVIDPDAAQFLNEKAIENAQAMMEKFGAPQAEIDKAITKMENESQFTIGKVLQSTAIQLIFYAVIGLIVGLIMKKNDPNLE